MLKKHYSPGILLINQKNHDKNAIIYLGNKYKNNKNYFSLSKNSNLNEAASNYIKLLEDKKKGFKKIQIAKIPKGIWYCY